MKKTISKIFLLITLIFSMTATALAGEFSVIDFNESPEDLLKKAPKTHMCGFSFVQPGYYVCILPEEETIFGEKSRSTCFNFYNQELYHIQFNLIDDSFEKFKEIAYKLEKEYGKSESVDMSNEYQKVILIKWVKPDKTIMITHYETKISKHKTTDINIIRPQQSKESNL